MEVRNAKYIDATGKRIDCEINHKQYGWIPYTIDPLDTDTTIDNQALLDILKQTDSDGNSCIAPYVPPTQEELDELASIQIRHIRNIRLRNDVDPIVSNPLRWEALTAEQQEEWRTYRNALLDITDQDSFPHNVIWPTKPE